MNESDLDLIAAFVQPGQDGLFTIAGEPVAGRPAALRAMEMKADVILKGTKVDGIYTADPMIDKNATRFEKISYLEVIEKGLKVMDATAITLCMDNRLPIIVFNLRAPGNLRRTIMGEPVGSIVS